jgi:hypothetical protein
MINRAFVSAVSLVGVVIDAVGGLYLAYDLLGGERGVLRLVTRSATYGAIFALGFGSALGVKFALVGALLFGPISAIELAWRSWQAPGARWTAAAFDAMRTGATGIGCVLTYDTSFGALFALIHGGLIAALRILKIWPIDIPRRASHRPTFGWRILAQSGIIGAAVLLSTMLSALILSDPLVTLKTALEAGLGVGLTVATLQSLSPFIEWWADHLPRRALGTLGAFLIVLGLCLQAFQYILALLNVTMK